MGQGPGLVSWVQTLQQAVWIMDSQPQTGVAATH